ncbi:MAG: hypothetical protein FRX49_06375 [Trebouxia sp. A1-2]|nr:MAG: hypothetical protein FRX49_06375 [Trebouxia sp. A1-2]
MLAVTAACLLVTDGKANDCGTIDAAGKGRSQSENLVGGNFGKELLNLSRSCLTAGAIDAYEARPGLCLLPLRRDNVQQPHQATAVPHPYNSIAMIRAPDVALKMCYAELGKQILSGKQPAFLLQMLQSHTFQNLHIRDRLWRCGHDALPDWPARTQDPRQAPRMQNLVMSSLLLCVLIEAQSTLVVATGG